MATDAGADVRAAWVRPDALAAFRPVADLVAAALAADGLDPGDRDLVRARLERRLGLERAGVVVDELVSLVSGSGDGAAAAEPDARRAARFRAWSDGLGALGTGPEVWLVEDVHWATPDVRAFVNLATAGDGARGRLVVCTARPSLLEEDGRWVSGGDRVALEPLSGDDTGWCVLWWATLSPGTSSTRSPRGPGEPALRRGAAAGLGEQRAARAGRAGLDDQRPGRRDRAAGDGPGHLRGPARRPPAPARRIVRRASVAGRRFPVAVLGRWGGGSAGWRRSSAAGSRRARSPTACSATATSSGTRSSATSATRASRVPSGRGSTCGWPAGWRGSARSAPGTLRRWRAGATPPRSMLRPRSRPTSGTGSPAPLRRRSPRARSSGRGATRSRPRRTTPPVASSSGRSS